MNKSKFECVDGFDKSVKFECVDGFDKFESLPALHFKLSEVSYRKLLESVGTLIINETPVGNLINRVCWRIRAQQFLRISPWLPVRTSSWEQIGFLWEQIVGFLWEHQAENQLFKEEALIHRKADDNVAGSSVGGKTGQTWRGFVCYIGGWGWSSLSSAPVDHDSDDEVAVGVHLTSTFIKESKFGLNSKAGLRPPVVYFLRAWLPERNRGAGYCEFISWKLL